MITPVFEITQDDANLTFKIRAPYAKLSGLEIEHTGNLFLFSCKPYFLRYFPLVLQILDLELICLMMFKKMQGKALVMIQTQVCILFNFLVHMFRHFYSCSAEIN